MFRGREGAEEHNGEDRWLVSLSKNWRRGRGGEGASKLAVFEIMENIHIMGVILQIINGKSQVKSVTKGFSMVPEVVTT